MATKFDSYKKISLPLLRKIFLVFMIFFLVPITFAFILSQIGGEIEENTYLIEQKSIMTFLRLYLLILLIVIPLLVLFMQETRSQFSFNGILWIGLIIRLLLAPVSGHEYDISVWSDRSKEIFLYREFTFTTDWFSSTLLYAIVLLAYLPYYVIHYVLGIPDINILSQSGNMTELFFIKTPIIIADLGNFYILKKILVKLQVNETNSVKYSSYFFLNPYVIFISSVWGMYDSVALFFTMLGFYFLFEEKIDKSAISYGLSVKFYSLAFIPLSCIFILEKFGTKKAIKYLLLGFLTFILMMTMPFIVIGDFSHLFSIFTARAQLENSQDIIFFGVTWWTLFGDQFLQLLPSPISEKIASYFLLIFFAPTYFLLLFIFFKRIKAISVSKKGKKQINSNNENLIKTIGLYNLFFIAVILLYFVTSPVVNDQFLIWICPNLVIYAYLKSQKISMKSALLPLVCISSIMLLAIFSIQRSFFDYFISGHHSMNLNILPSSSRLAASYTFSSLAASLLLTFIIDKSNPNDLNQKQSTIYKFLIFGLLTSLGMDFLIILKVAPIINHDPILMIISSTYAIIAIFIRTIILDKLLN